MLDAQILLQPFEEQLNLPALLVNGGYRVRRQVKSVGQKDQMQAAVTVKEADPAKRLRVAPLGRGVDQTNGLVSRTPKRVSTARQSEQL